MGIEGENSNKYQHLFITAIIYDFMTLPLTYHTILEQPLNHKASLEIAGVSN